MRRPGSLWKGDIGDANPGLWLLGRYGKPHSEYLGVAVVGQAVGRFPEVLPSLIIGIAIDAIFLQEAAYTLPLVPDAWLPETLMGQALLTVVILALTYPTDAFFDFVSSRANGTFNQRFQHDVRTDVFDTVQRLEMGFFDERETGDVMSVLNDDVRELRSFTGAIGGVIRFGTLAFAMYVYLFWLNWQLAFLLIVVPVALAVLSYWFSNAMEPRYAAVRESVGRLNNRLNNNIGGVSVIKSFGTEDREYRRVEEASAEYRDTQWSAHRIRTTMDPTLRIVSEGSRAITLIVGGYWVLFGAPLFFSGTLTTGALFTFFYNVGSLATPMQLLAGTVDDYQNGNAAAKRLAGVIEADGRTDDEDAEPLPRIDGDVSYEDVQFTYDSRDEASLRDVTFRVDAGETVGIVGPTGAGKSTLLKLLFRFYDPDRGTIRIDGRDIRGATVESLRESLGYVSQDPFLFYGTVRENIAYGLADVSDDRVREAAKLAGAHEFVEGLPDGYDTVVGERGVKLSGGQRQRLAIARAVVRDPSILVLDEATSHVDNETEVLIHRAMDTVAADRTTFIIAHRLSTVRDADTILVLDDGEIVERGAHDELLEADGLYANLWRIQVGDVDTLPEAFLDRVRRGEVA